MPPARFAGTVLGVTAGGAPLPPSETIPIAHTMLIRFDINISARDVTHPHPKIPDDS